MRSGGTLVDRSLEFFYKISDCICPPLMPCVILSMNAIRGVHMSFYKEPTHYEKTALSDLQGAWTILRDTVVENFGFPGSDKIIFHIDEAMSWECVRDLKSRGVKSSFLTYIT